MVENRKAIFREEVFRRFARARREPVWPRWVAPRSSRVLWALVALVFAAAWLAWRTPLPVFVRATAVVVRSRAASDRVELAVLLARREAERVRVGDRVYATSGGAEGTLVALDAAPSSPIEVVARLSLGGAAASAVAEPVVVAFAELDPTSELVRDASYLGSVRRVTLRVGERPALSYVPWIGEHLRGAR